jgi:hypothetical protein
MIDSLAVAFSVRDQFEVWASGDSRNLQPQDCEDREDRNNHYYLHDCDNEAFIGWKAAMLFVDAMIGDQVTSSVTAERPFLSIGAIPEHLYWLIGKGRTKPSEPIYGAQFIDPESGIAIAEGEGETFDEAIAAALRAMPGTTSLSATEGRSDG